MSTKSGQLSPSLHPSGSTSVSFCYYYYYYYYCCNVRSSPDSSGIAMIFGPPTNNLFGPLAKGLGRLLLHDGSLQPRGSPAVAGPAGPSLRHCLIAITYIFQTSYVLPSSFMSLFNDLDLPSPKQVSLKSNGGKWEYPKWPQNKILTSWSHLFLATMWWIFPSQIFTLSWSNFRKPTSQFWNNKILKRVVRVSTDVKNLRIRLLVTWMGHCMMSSRL